MVSSKRAVDRAKRAIGMLSCFDIAYIQLQQGISSPASFVPLAPPAYLQQWGNIGRLRELPENLHALLHQAGNIIFVCGFEQLQDLHGGRVCNKNYNMQCM